MVKRGLVIAAIITVLVITSSVIYIIAQANIVEATVVAQNINPNARSAYAFKRLVEKLALSYIQKVTPNRQAEFLASLANRRLAEIQYIIVYDDSTKYIEKSTSRYLTTLGLLGSNVTTASDARKVEQMIADHPAFLAASRDKFPAQTPGWLFLQQCLDTANGLLAKLGKIG